jgi:hypothetical protein
MDMIVQSCFVRVERARHPQHIVGHRLRTRVGVVVLSRMTVAILLQDRSTVSVSPVLR